MVIDTAIARGPGIASQYLYGGLKLPTIVVPGAPYTLFDRLQAVNSHSVYIHAGKTHAHRNQNR